jgi:formate--tetrahydrofolate ligase
MKSDIEIAQSCVMLPIQEVASSMGLNEDDLVPYGRYIAKVPIGIMERLGDAPEGRLVLVTAMSPTPMGEGKTTTTIGLGQALRRLGRRVIMTIREPSLGPCMGIKGGAAGGGYSQVLPMEDINLHFTGDIHAVTSAHNLIAAVTDNHLHHRLSPQINPRHIVWKRVIDMNDRCLRSIILGLEDRGLNGVMREDGFEITAASEVMAVLCLSMNLREAKERIEGIIVGYDHLKKPVFVRDTGGAGAAAALLKHAMNPNLVQSVEGAPVLVHGGPFANIAHGCSSLAATKMALRLAEYTVTEAGFGVDLGAEKFFHIKCRTGALRPSAAVMVVTLRAYRLHGIENIRKHLDTLNRFGVPSVVSINRFEGDDDCGLEDLRARCIDLGAEAFISDFRESGGEGGPDLAERVVELCGRPSSLRMLYDLSMPVVDKVRTVAAQVYGATDVEFSPQAISEIRAIENMGYGGLPVCIAKTQSSLTDNPKVPGLPEGPFTVKVSSARVSAGAGVVVVFMGRILAMPGLPRTPAALSMDVDGAGTISGLF